MKPTWTSFDDWAARIGSYAWMEQRLFELLGGWSAVVPQPEVCELLARHARRRAGHAELWHRLLPTVAGRAPGDLVRPPSTGAADVLAALSPERASGGGTVDLLVAVYRVVGPSLAATHSAHLATASPVAEAPTIRTLQLVVADQSADLDEGRRLLGSPAVVDDRGRTAELEPVIQESWSGSLPERWAAP